MPELLNGHDTSLVASNQALATSAMAISSLLNSANAHLASVDESESLVNEENEQYTTEYSMKI